MSACSGQSLDLLERPAELWAPQQKIELGTDEALPRLGQGWWPAGEGKPVYRWMIEPRARVEINLPEGARALALEVLARSCAKPSKPELELRLGQASLGVRQLAPGWNRVEFPAPAMMAGRAPLDLEIRGLADCEEPAERRPLRLAVRTLEVLAPGSAPAPQPAELRFTESPLSMPGGGSCAWPIRLEGGEILQLRSRLEAGTSARLRLAWEDAEGVHPLGTQPRPGALLPAHAAVALPWSGEGKLRLDVQGAWSDRILLDSLRLERRSRPEPESVAKAKAPRPRGLIVYLFDALRFDSVGFDGQAGGLSPNLDRAVRAGRMFSNFHGACAWTRPSVATLFTGLQPWNHGVQTRDSVLPDQALTLADALGEEGWFTGTVVANANVSTAFGMTQGFEKLIEGYRQDALLARHPANPKLRSDDLNQLAGQLLDAAGDRPFFLYLHSVDPHQPYVPPAGLEGWQDQSQRGLYSGSIRGNDEQIGRLLGMLRARGLLDTTWILFVADHGEEFQDHGGARHGHSLYEELTRLPLLLLGPGVEPGLDEAPVEMADLAPSLLAALGFLEPGARRAQAFDGRILDLAGNRPSAPTPRPLLAREILDSRSIASLTQGRYKLILNRKRVELYDLASDPGERKSLALELPFLRDALRAELMLGLRPSRPLEKAELQPGKLDGQVESQLRALGYIE